jgi:protoporphyrinogen oxidase
MKIAIIGAGFTGLSAAFELLKKGHEVVIFEENSLPGGLALGYKKPGWDWSLEKYYHHWFTNDKSILSLAKEINFEVITKRPKTSVYIKDRIFQLDSPSSVLLFPLLSFAQRIRMSAVLGFLRFNPFWKPLEQYKAAKILPKLMGKKAYELIWEPLFINKFGNYSNTISLAWFWARINKRTPSLAYPKGGFLEFSKTLTKEIEKRGGKFYFDTKVVELRSGKGSEIKFQRSGESRQKRGSPEAAKLETDNYDIIIVTLSSFLFMKIAPQLPKSYKEKLRQLKSLGATNLVLRLSKPFFKDNTYWLNVCDKKAPVMAIVEHTNYMDKKNYNQETLLYLGNYKATDDKNYLMTKEEMLKQFDPFLKRLNPNYDKSIIGYELFKNPFAQTIISVNYSKIIPPFKTPLKNVFLANMEQVYPWDRGTNYAVEYGKKVIKEIFSDA